MRPVTVRRLRWGDGDRVMQAHDVIHWLSVATALVLAAFVAVRDPGRSLFEQSMRALGVEGLLIQPLSLLSAASWVFVALMISYAATWIALRALVGARG